MSAADLVRRRVRGDFVVDEWGLDNEMFDIAVALGRLRWDIDVQGLEHIPGTGPALLVVERHWGISELAVVANAVARFGGRRVRCAGIPGVRFMEAPLRKFGAALAHPDEISGLLRDGHVVAVALALTPYRAPGAVEAPLVAPAPAASAPVIPVATSGHELGRHWRVAIGKELPPPDVVGHLAAVELAEGARAAVADLHRASERP